METLVYPRVIPWNKNHPSADQVIYSMLSGVNDKIIVRITGGCANMSEEDSVGVSRLFKDAFSGFEGVILIGGTRMVMDEDPEKVLFGITEVATEIRKQNPNSCVMGVIPRMEGFEYIAGGQLWRVIRISDTDAPEHTTVVHPNQDIVIATSGRLTKGEPWDDEAEFCRMVTSNLSSYGGWKNLLVAYNGGGVTERDQSCGRERLASSTGRRIWSYR